MDQQQEIPTLRGETNKREEKKKSGLLANLLGKLGGGGAASGGAGAAGSAGFGGAAVSGGLLATKAGIVALIVAGTSVAGGLGLVGYKIFGGSGSSGGGGIADSFNSLFASHPKPGPAQEGDKKAADAGASGSSSLQYLADGNKGTPAEEEKKPEAPAAAAPDANKDAAANSASAALGAVGKAMSNNNAPSSGPAAKLSGVGMKMGQLSATTGSGSSGASYTMGAGAKGNDLLANAAQLGKAKGMAGGGLASTSSNKGIAAVSRRGKAFSQLGSVLRDNRGAGSSAGAGRTYDGGAAQSGFASTTQGSGIEGLGSGGKDKAPSAPSNNPRTDKNKPDLTVPSVPGQPVTPWQNSMDTAKYALMGSVGMLLIAKMLVGKAEASFKESTELLTKAQAATLPAKKMPILSAALEAQESAALMLKLAIAALVAAGLAGLFAMSIGINIMGGEFKQTTAGLAFMLGGAGAAAASMIAAKALWGSLSAVQGAASSTAADLAEQASLVAASATPGSAAAVAKSAAASAKDLAASAGANGVESGANAVAAGKIEALGSSPMLMYATGGAAIVGLGVAYLSKPTTVDPKDCPNHKCHDNSFRFHVRTPEEEIVAKYLG